MFLFSTFLEFIRDKEYRDLIITTLLVLIVGTLVYHFVEGWAWLDSLYFCVITLSTIGYGDFAPQTDLGKGFTILYITIGIGIILSFINTLYHHFSKSQFQDLRKMAREERKEKFKNTFKS
jgi:voltage-gated potassium channel